MTVARSPASSAAAGASEVGLLRRTVRRAGQAARRAPVTGCLLLAVWVCTLGSAAVFRTRADARDAFAFGLPTLTLGHWWTPVTALLWCRSPEVLVVSTLLTAVLMGPAEQRLGSRRTLTIGLAGHLLGVVVALGLAGLGAFLGEPWSAELIGQRAAGPSTGAVAVALAATARLGALTRRRLRLLLVVALVALALYSGTLQDLTRLTAGLAGLTLGALVGPGTSPPPARRSSRPETRLLVALLVAASAAGPLVAVLSGAAVGPLSVLRFVVTSPVPDPTTVRAACGITALAEDCATLQARVRLGGIGPAFMSFLPVLLLLIVADGLRRGRRFAWWGAVALNLGLAALATVQTVSTSTSALERRIAFGGAPDAQLNRGLVAAVAQPLLITLVLLVARRRFAVAAPRGSCRGWLLTVAVTLAGTSAVYVAGGVLLRRGFAPIPTLGDVFTDLPTRFLPPGYLGEVDITYLPTDPTTTVLYEWTGVTFWAVAAVATLAILRRTHAPVGDAVAARTLLTSTGGSSLAWWTTWDGNSYWFTPDRRAAVAYRVVGGVALTTGEPFGDPTRCTVAVTDFARHCAEQGWIPCFYSVGATVADIAERLGWAATQIAEETIVPLAGLTFTGRRRQDIRTALHKAARDGVVADFVTFAHAPHPITRQIRAIAEEWVAEKGLPEMRFTLGGLDELADDRVRCLVARDAAGTVHGITSWLPVHTDGVVTGWTLDFMRRGPTAMKGTTEFLIASAAQRFQQEGAAFISLSGAPLARLDRGERLGALERLLDSCSRTLEPVYGFRSLLAFKAKFQPEFRPLYVTYPDGSAIPAIAAAVTRAYLPDLSPRGGLALLHRLHTRDE